MATLRKRGNKWHVQVRRAGQPSQTQSFTTKADARAWANAMEVRAEQAQLPPSGRQLSRTTFGNLLQQYAASITPRKRSAEIEQYRIGVMLRDPIAKRSLDYLTPSAIAAYRDRRASVVGPQAVVHDLNLIGHVLRIAATEWDIPLTRNPAAEVIKPRLPSGRERRVTDHELDLLRMHATPHEQAMLIPLVELALQTAMRRGELLGIEWRHVDLSKRLLTIPQAKNGCPRTIPLTSVAQGLLSALHSTETLGPFTLSPNATKLAWARLTKRSGLTDLHFHDLRHEAISRFFERGLSVPEVALISGHRDYRMLFRYTHLKAEDVATNLS